MVMYERFHGKYVGYRILCMAKLEMLCISQVMYIFMYGTHIHQKCDVPYPIYFKIILIQSY